MERNNGERDNHTTSCNFLDFNKMSKVKKVFDDAREQNNPELDLVDKGITSFEEMPALREYIVHTCAVTTPIQNLLPNMDVGPVDGSCLDTLGAVKICLYTHNCACL